MISNYLKNYLLKLLKKLLPSYKFKQQTIATDNFYKIEEELKKAANNENSIHQSELQYQLYALKYNLNKNIKNDAIEWCQKAAENNHAAAQYDLALHYLYGNLVEQDLYQALIWLEKSGNQGYKPSLQTLIRLYKSGVKIRKNDTRAQYWYARLQNSSYCDIYQLPPITKEATIPLKKEKVKKKRTFSNEKELFKEALQSDVIEANKNTSFVINAGPGTGKTYTIVKKIEHLVDNQEVDANGIILLSFTNAVVKEVKYRLAQFVKNEMGDRSLNNVKVKTFHSFAYWILKQANENLDVLLNWEAVNLSLNRLTYDDCMVKGADLMEHAPEILQDCQYVIVDEIQDINHGKARFVLSILRACIKHKVPYCLLGDSCQAIYDYLDEKNSSEVKITSEEFYEKLVALSQDDTQFLSFSKNYRSNTLLQEQASPIRENILERMVYDFPVLVAKYKNSIKSLKFDHLNEFIESHKNHKICILERSNISTRKLSTLLTERKIEHLCTLSISKDAYPQWLGKIFGGFNEEFITYDNLYDLFEKANFNAEDCEICWNKLKQIISQPSPIIKFKYVIYAMQTHELDDLFKNTTQPNVTVSNIHRAKGLEYDYVFIDENFLSPIGKTLEEMKVLYVAITRAKTETICLQDTGASSYMKKIDWSNRHYKRKKLKDKTFKLKQIEIIVNNETADIGPESYIVDNMQENQVFINTLEANEAVELRYDNLTDTYGIAIRNQIIGKMNPSFTKTVFFLNNGNPVPKFTDIFIDGIYTYIGSTSDYKPKFEYKVIKSNSIYSKYRIWNYVAFSGLATAVYD